jgi:hypothetical protein
VVQAAAVRTVRSLGPCPDYVIADLADLAGLLRRLDGPKNRIEGIDRTQYSCFGRVLGPLSSMHAGGSAGRRGQVRELPG